MLAFVSLLWQHVASAAVATPIGTILDCEVITHVGAGMMALGWVGVVLLTLVLMMMFLMLISINLLDRLTDD
jgi:Ca2+ regulator and membrane fusion protein Fig1